MQDGIDQAAETSAHESRFAQNGAGDTYGRIDPNLSDVYCRGRKQERGDPVDARPVPLQPGLHG